MIKTVIIFFGPPASGKGTQASFLAEAMDLPIISTGNLLRQEKKDQTEIGKLAEELVDQGKLVPDDIIEKMITNRLAKDDTRSGFIFDGYPRNATQLELVKKRMDKLLSEQDKLIVIYVRVDDEVVKKRISGRRMCNCGETYHIETNPPAQTGICDDCGGELYQRKDDSSEVISERLKVYHNKMNPVIDYYRENGKFIEVDGGGTIEEVRKYIKKELD